MAIFIEFGFWSKYLITFDLFISRGPFTNMDYFDPGMDK